MSDFDAVVARVKRNAWEAKQRTKQHISQIQQKQNIPNQIQNTNPVMEKVENKYNPVFVDNTEDMELQPYTNNGLKDTGLGVAQGLASLGSTAITVGDILGTQVKNNYRIITGDFENVRWNDNTNRDALRNLGIDFEEINQFYEQPKSDAYHDQLEGFNAVIDDSDISLGDKALQLGKKVIHSPNLIGSTVGSSAPQILVGGIGGAGIKGAATLNMAKQSVAGMSAKEIAASLAGRTAANASAIGEGGIAGLSALDQIVQKKGQDLDSLDVATATSIGAVTGVLSRYLGGGTGDPESLATHLLSGGKNIAINQIKKENPITAIPREIAQEYGQEGAESVLTQLNENRNGTVNYSQVLGDATLGAAAGGVTSAGASGISLTTGAGKKTIDSADKATQAVKDKIYDTSIENKLNPEHKKYSPTGALQDSIQELTRANDLGDSKKKQVASNNINKSLVVAQEQLNKLDDEIEQATDPIIEQQLQEKKSKYLSEVIEPLNQQFSVYQEGLAQNDNDRFIAGLNQFRDKQLQQALAGIAQNKPITGAELTSSASEVQSPQKTLKPSQNGSNTLVAVVGDYSKKDTGIGTGAHLDIRYARSMYPKGTRPRMTKDHLDRFKVDGKPLSEWQVSSDYGNRKAPVKGASTFHEGIDFPLNGAGSQVYTDYPVKNVRSFDNNKDGGGWVTEVTFADGVTAVMLHQNKEGAEQAATSFRNQKPVQQEQDRFNQLSKAEQIVLTQARKAVASKPAFAKYAKQYGVPLNIIIGIIAQESQGKFDAKSPTGAIGLLQQTGAFRKDYGLTEADSWNASDKAIEATVKYLAGSLKEFGNMGDMIRSYNGGRAGTRAFNNGTFKGSAARTREVREYVGKVTRFIVDGSNEEMQLELNLDNSDYEVNLPVENTEKTKDDIEDSSPEQKENNKQEIIKRFSSFTAEQIDNNPLLNNAQKVSLRKLLSVKQQLNESKDTNAVAKEIIEGSKGKDNLSSNLGLKDYTATFNRAVSTQDIPTIQKYMGMLDNWVANHQSKADVIESVLPKASKENPVYIAPDDNNIWKEVNKFDYTDTEFKEAGGLEIQSPSSLTKSVISESRFMTEFRDTWKDAINNLYDEEIIFSKVKLNDNKKSISKTNDKNISEEIGLTESPKSNYSDKFTRVQDTTNIPNDGIFIGRGKQVSLFTNIEGNKNNAIGKAGWLGMPYNTNKNAPKVFRVKDTEEGLDKYVNLFKEKFAIPEFRKAVIENKNKKLYANEKAGIYHEANFLAEVFEQLPNDEKAAIEFISNIESFNPETKKLVLRDTNKNVEAEVDTLIDEVNSKESKTTESNVKEPSKKESETTTYKEKEEKIPEYAGEVTQFIGTGKENPLSKSYKEKWEDRANTGKYSDEDVVYVYALGNIDEIKDNIQRAVDAKASIVTNNSPSKELIKLLKQSNYSDKGTKNVWSLKIKEYGKISALRGVTKVTRESELAKDYQKRNYLISGFIQKNTPLTTINKFLTGITEDLTNWIKQNGLNEPDDKQQAQLEDFIRFKNEFAENLLAVFVRKDVNQEGVDYGYQDLKSFLVDENGQIDENTLTALSLSVYSWIIERGQKDRNYYDDIKKLLNVDPDNSAYIPEDIIKQYQHIGELDVFLADKIGSKAVELLGLQTVKEVSPVWKSRMSASLGMWALWSMESAGLVQFNELSSEQHKSNIDKVKGDSSGLEHVKGVVKFFSVTDTAGVFLSKEISKIQEINKGTKGYLTKLFKQDIGLVYPSLTKPEKVIRSIRRADYVVSEEQAQFMQQMQDTPLAINMKTYDALMDLYTLDQSFVESMLGARVSQEELDATHISNRDNKQDAANGRLRELNNAIDFISGLENNKSYLPIVPYGNTRMGYKSNIFNIQFSKLHGSLAEYKGSETEIDLTTLDLTDEEGNLTLLGMFFKTIAEHAEGTESIIEEGLKDSAYTQGFTEDKIAGVDLLPILIDYLQNDKQVLAAVASTKKLINKETLDQSDKDNIANVVSTWDMQGKSFRALIEYTLFYMALEAGDSSFTTSFTHGSDGVNNGSAISQIQMGVANDLFLKQVGFFTKDSNINNYFEARKDFRIGDYYTGFKQYLDNALDAIGESKTLHLIQKLNINLRKRKMFKALLIPFGYSAGIPRLQEAAFEQFLEDIKTNLESAVKNKDMHKFDEIIGNLEELLNDKINTTDSKNPLDIWLDQKQINKLEKIYTDNIGHAVKESIIDYASEFMKAREENVAYHNASYNMFEALRNEIYEEAKQQRIKELTDKYKKLYPDENTNTWTKKAIEEFNVENFSQKELDEIETKVKAITPKLHNAFDYNSNNTDSNFVLYESGTELKADGVTETKNYSTVSNKNKFNKQPSRYNVIKQIGLKLNSKQVQSVDAKVAAVAATHNGVNTNNHDSTSTGLKNYIGMVQTQNKTVYQSLINYHVQAESLTALVSTLSHYVKTQTNFVQIAKDLTRNIPYQERIKLYKDWGNFKGDFLNEVLKPLIRNKINKGIERDLAKLDILDTIKVVHQYAGEGGQYLTTEFDKESIKTEHTKLNTLKEKLLDELDNLKSIKPTNKLVEIKVNKKVTHVVPEYFIDNKINATKALDDLLEISSNQLNKDDRASLETLLKFYHSIDKDIDIAFYKDSISILNEASKEKSFNKISGRSGIRNGQKTLFINLNTSTVGLDLFETLVHEYTHATNQKALKKEKENAGKIFKELEKIQNIVRENIAPPKNKRDKDIYNYFITNINEVLTVGTTNPAISKLLKNYKYPFKEFTREFNQLAKDLNLLHKNQSLYDRLLYLQTELIKGNTDGNTAISRERDRRADSTNEQRRDDSSRVRSNRNDKVGFQNGKDDARGDEPDRGRTQKKNGESVQKLVKNLLNNLANSKKTDVTNDQKELASYLLNKIANTIGLTYEYVTQEELGNFKAKGAYNPETNTIQLLESFMRSDSNYFGKTALVLHESLHALTEANIANPTPETQKAINELNKLREQLLNEVTDSTPEVVKIALKSVNEMISYGLTDPVVIDFIGTNISLKKAEVKGVYHKSGLAKFLNLVGSLFGWFKSSSKGKRGFTTFVNLVEQLTKPIEKPTEQTSTSKRFSEFTAEDIINEQSAVEILSSLSNNTNGEFNKHLDNIINEIIGKHYKNNENNKQKVDATLENFKSSAIVAGFRLSDKEAYVNEVLIEVVKTYIERHSGTAVINDLRKIYKELSNQIKIKDFGQTDWDTSSKLEKQQAKKQYDYLFGNEQPLEYLPRLIALGLSSEQFSTLIDKPRQKQIKTEQSWFDKLMSVFQNIVNWLTSAYLGTKGNNIPDQLNQLMVKLQKIDSQARNNKWSIETQVFKSISKITKPMNFALSTGLSSFLNKTNFQESKIPFLKQVTTISKALDMGMPEVLGYNIDAAAKSKPNQRLNPIIESLNEIKANKSINYIVEKAIRYIQHIGQFREKVNDNTIKQLSSYFKDIKSVTKAHRDSVTTMVLRTDMSCLLEHGYSLDTIMEYLTDDKKRQDKIVEIEKRIIKQPNGNDILMQTRALGSHMTLENTPDHLVKSAEGIATGLGSWYQTDFDKMNNELFSDIDVLASLYAVNYTSKSSKIQFNSLIQNESDAVKKFISFHKEMTILGKQDFKNNPLNYSKGFMPQHTHTSRNMVFAESLEEIEKLEKEGYQRVYNDYLKQDTSDKTDPRILMIHMDIKKRKYVSGALDMKETKAKGTTVYDISNSQELGRVAKEKFQRRKERNNQSYKAYDPIDSAGSMVPTYRTDGSLLNYHYEMQGFVRDQYLDRNNDAIDLLAMYHSNIVAKPQIENQQKQVAHVFYDDFKENYLKNPKLFLILDPESTDPKVVEQWRMLPYEFKQEAAKLFGKGKPIIVRSTIYNVAFGFKAYSVTEMFDKLSGERNSFERFIVGLFEGMFNEKGKDVAGSIEYWVEKMVGLAKDLIVIRSGKVLLGNIIANSMLLMMHGITPTQQVKDFLLAWREGKRYTEAQDKILQINIDLNTEKDEFKITKLKNERSQLEAMLNNNPMREYMEEGLMSTIVEDTEIFSDKKKFRTPFEEKLDKKLDKVPSSIKTGFDWLVMNPNTPLYQFMADMTQFSDFAAKYSLANHLRRNKKYSLDGAINEAQESFINYDVPTSKGLDYMNRIGIFMFTKFVLRFQKVLIKQIKEKPASILMQHFMTENLTDFAGILDPYWVSRLGNNPFNDSAFTLLEAGDELMTYDLFTGAF